jgi:hypothetical protein
MENIYALGENQFYYAYSFEDCVLVKGKFFILNIQMNNGG